MPQNNIYQPKYPKTWTSNNTNTLSGEVVIDQPSFGWITTTTSNTIGSLPKIKADRKCVICGKKSTKTVKTQFGHECQQCWDILEKYNKK